MGASAAQEQTVEPAVLPVAMRGRLLAWGGVLFLIPALTASLMAIPVLFFLKNKLRLAAPQTAWFLLLTGIPLYLGFAFGLVRDRWNPLGLGDRAHLGIFGLAAGAMYLVIALVPPTYGLLLAGLLLVTAAAQMVAGATNAILSGLGREHLMPGQASAVLNTASTLPVVIGSALGGAFSDLLEGQKAGGAARALFGTGAALMALTAVLGLIAPAAILPHRQERTRSFVADLGRLGRTWAVWPPFIVLTLWNFAPGFGTALQYHLADQVHASDTEVGAFYAIFWGMYLPAFALYGWLCQRLALSRLLFWGTIIAIPQALPLLLVRTPAEALAVAVPMGLTGGIASAAFIDLAIRSAPVELQGTMLMLVGSTAYYVALRFGDLWGTALYARPGGFTAVVWVTTLVYVLMLPVILLAPRHLTTTRDGEPIATMA